MSQDPTDDSVAPLELSGLIVPDWPAAEHVRAYCTTRAGGVSQPPYASLNLADHVGDEPNTVRQNRGRLASALRLPGEPLWLRQVHGRQVVDAAVAAVGVQADASFARQPDTVCAVLTADCLPVLFCNRTGSVVAAAHAGWRGLATGVLEAAVDRLDCPPRELLVWLGPAIGPEAFEVGGEVREAFVHQDRAAAAAFAKSGSTGRWFADIYALARQRLRNRGIGAIYGGNWCTHTDSARFYSYRRDRVTGRMASLIWLSRRP